MTEVEENDDDEDEEDVEDDLLADAAMGGRAGAKSCDIGSLPSQELNF